MGNLGQELKYDKDKPRLDLVPPDAVIAIGTIMTYGISKYDEGSWKSVEPYRYRAALMRHMMEYLRDADSVDTESGYKHLWHLICNAAFLCELEGDKKSRINTSMEMYIKSCEAEYGLEHKDLYKMTNKEFVKYVNFLNELQDK